MSNKSILICFILLVAFLGGCKAFNGNKWDVTTTILKKKDLPSSLTSVNISNNLITIQGTGFSNVTTVQLKGSTLDTSLSINSKSNSQIIASAASAISLLAGETFKLIIGTAEAQVSYDVTFTLQNGAVQLSHLSNMGATSAGQILKFNGTSWAPAFFSSSQNYRGTWNPSTNAPDDISSIGSYSPGDYYIVSTVGTFTSGVLTTSPTTFAVGNWVMFNGLTWDKVLNGNLSGAGITNYIPYYSSANVLTNSPLVVSGSSIGIGTATPGSSLDVKGVLRLSGATSGFVGLAPAAVAGGTTYTLPAADGTNGQVLTTNASGVLSWTSISVSGGTVTGVTSANADIGVANGASAPVLTLNSGTSADQIVKLTAAAKLPAVDGSLLTNLTSTNLVGAVAVENGGTGAATAADARFSLLGATSAGIGNSTGNIPKLGINGIVANNICTGDNTGGIICNNLPSSTILSSVSDESGTGALLFGTSPIITTPVITRIVPADDFTLFQNGVAPFTSVNTGAVANTLYLNAGKVGIGTTAPLQALQVNGKIAVPYNAGGPGNGRIGISSADGGSMIHSLWGDSGISHWTSTDSVGMSIEGSTNQYLAFSPGASEKVRFLANGNVGIGTTTPSSILSVSGTDSVIDINNTSSGFSGISYSKSGTTYGHNGVASTAGAGIGGSALGDFFIRSQNKNILFSTNGGSSAQMIINSSGNVGIGTTTPQSKLHIATDGSSANSGTLSLGAGAYDGTTSGYFGTGSSSNSSGTELAINAASGYAGDLANFEVAGSSKFKVSSAGVVTAATLNATSTIQLGGASINTAGTLSNVAYLNQANNFSSYWGQTFNGNYGVTSLNNGSENVTGGGLPNNILNYTTAGQWVGAADRNSYMAWFAGGGGNGNFPSPVLKGNAAIYARMRLDSDTFTATSAQTITNGSTLYIGSVPTSSGNVTVTNPYALYVNTGNSYFGGNVGIGTTSPSYLTHIYSTATSGQPQLAIQNDSDTTVPILSIIRRRTSGAAVISGDSLGRITASAAKSSSANVGAGYFEFQAKAAPATNTIQSAMSFYTYTSADDYSTYGMTYQNGGLGLGGTTGRLVFNKNDNVGGDYAPDTGISRLAANKIAVGNSTQGDYTGTLIAGSVGIGTTSPTSLLNISRDGSAAPAYLTLSDTVAQNNAGAAINWAGSGSNAAIQGSIKVQAVGIPNYRDSAMMFSVGAAGSITPNEVMRLLQNGNVGIGTTNPGQKLEANGNILVNKGTSNRTTLLSDNGLFISRISDGGYASTITADGHMTFLTRNNYYFTTSGASANPFTILETGNVGIGITGPTTKLQVAGEISPSVDNTYPLGDSSLRFTYVYATNGTIQTSDARLKKEIKNTDLGLEFINKLRPVSYYWNSGPDKEQHYGLIAQEAEEVLVKANKRSTNKTVPIVDHDTKNDRYGIKYTELISPLVKAIQELYGEIKGLVARVLSVELKTTLNERAIASNRAEAKKENEALVKKLEEKTKNLETENTTLKKKLEVETMALRKENIDLKTKAKKVEYENSLIKSYLCAKDSKAAFCQ
jgi:hypothetical protein